MTADDLEFSTMSAVINYGCALSRLRFADRRYSADARSACDFLYKAQSPQAGEGCGINNCREATDY